MTAKENSRRYFRRMLAAGAIYTAATLFAGYMTRQLVEGDVGASCSPCCRCCPPPAC
jgi:hypothetical protein